MTRALFSSPVITNRRESTSLEKGAARTATLVSKTGSPNP